MQSFKFIETFFFLSLAITFALIVTLVYHFKKRMENMETKCDTMFDIVQNLAKEVLEFKKFESQNISTRDEESFVNNVAYDNLNDLTSNINYETIESLKQDLPFINQTNEENSDEESEEENSDEESEEENSDEESEEENSDEESEEEIDIESEDLEINQPSIDKIDIPDDIDNDDGINVNITGDISESATFDSVEVLEEIPHVNHPELQKISLSALKKKTKTSLQELAKEYNLIVNDDMTKNDIITLITAISGN